MEIQKLRTEGRGADKLRNVRRLWIEVESESLNVMVEGRLVRDKARIEIYEDRLPGVRSMVRSESDRAIRDQAKALADKKLEDWKQKHKKAIADAPNAEAFIRASTSISVEGELALLGYPRGLPPLLSCKVINPAQTSEMIDADDFLKLPEDKRRKYLIDPPLTPENAQQVAMERLAERLGASQAELVTALAEALSKKAGK